MAARTIIQLGAGAWMRATTRRLRAEGYRVVALDKNPNAPAFVDADDYAAIDIVDADAIERFARTMSPKPDLLMVVNGAGVISGAVASARLGLPALAVDVAERSQDKGLFRDACRAAGLPQPTYRVVQRGGDLAKAAEEIGYPVVVKPARKWGSRGVSLVPDASYLEQAVVAATGEGSDALVVETCLRGLEISIEGVVQNGRSQILAVGDKEMQEHPRYRVGMALDYPSALPAATLALIDDVVAGAIRAMGISSGAFDAECMVNEEGVFIIEINPRPGGGHIFGQIVESVSGVCMPVAYVKLMLGEPVDVRPKYQRGVCYRFFAPPHGVFQSVTGLEEARTMPGVLDMDFTMPPGTRVGPIAADADRPGFVVAAGKDRAEANANARRAISSLRFTVDPS
jgi:biotin carboxylase